MIEQIPFAVQVRDGMVIVSVQAEEAAFVGEELSRIGIGPHRIIRNHILDGSVREVKGIASGLPVGTIGVDVFVSDPVEAGILKQPWNIQADRVSVQMDHILSQPDDAPRAGGCLLSLRYAASEGKVAGAVLIHHYRGIEQPGNVGAVLHGAGDQQAAPLIPPGPGRAVRDKDADAVSAVAEIQEELFLTVDRLMGSAGGPGIDSPPGDSVRTGYPDLPVIGPVDQVIRGDAVDRADLAVGILLYFSRGVVFDDIVGHIDVKAPVILHDAGIGAETLGIQGIVLVRFFVGLLQDNRNLTHFRFFSPDTGYRSEN